MPDEPEALGLLALMLLQDSRRDARVGADGELVLLEDQDRGSGTRRGSTRARACSSARSRSGGPAPYQLQAAIAGRSMLEEAGPTGRRSPRSTPSWRGSSRRRSSSSTARSRSRWRDGPERGLELVEQIDLPGYHLLHAARADFLRRLERRDEAASAYRDALALEMNAGDRAFLERRLAEVVRS